MNAAAGLILMVLPFFWLLWLFWLALKSPTKSVQVPLMQVLLAASMLAIGRMVAGRSLWSFIIEAFS